MNPARARTPGVAAVTPPAVSPDGKIATVIAFPRSKPQDRATQDLVTRLRTTVLPPLAHETGARIMIGGTTAATVDFADAVAARLLLFIAVVIGLSALLLLLVFRSLLIPLKAAVLNVLSVGAALGVITLVFQNGVLGGALGIEPGPIEAFVPVMIFAIAFGLSMDYEVFLLARMHEVWERTRDPQVAIREGMATTGRVVTAAAAIMVVVFASFLLDPSRMLQQFGLGLAVAVLLDALIIRCLIVPAAMSLLGTRAWWLPARIGRRLPRVALERRHSTGPAPEGTHSAAERAEVTSA
jgi:RND superfamily putative drug exporter